ncbi:MAG: SDR family NAD(P)-dependent oxidoreductase, partial [Tateyamaria sp.]
MRTVVVTGGTRGIGAGVSLALADAGWSVIAASASQAELDAFDHRDVISPKFVDVTDDASVARLFTSMDRLDALVNCAGILRRHDEFDIDTFCQVIDVNLVGTMRCCLAARDQLAKTGGSIVNTASMLSTFGGPLVPAYSASKGGVAQLTKSLAGAWADEGIRV